MRTHRLDAMKKLNLVLNLALFLAGLFLAGTGVLLAWRLPHGRGAGMRFSFLGLDRHEWGELHLWLGVAMAAGVLLHLGLHWRWIWRVAAHQHRTVVLSLGLLTVAVLGFFACYPVS